MSSLRRIEIVGGGLAGLALGLALVRRGIPVTVHEAGHYPRHRVCGEFMTGLGPATIARLGLEPLLADAVRNRSIAWHLRGELIREQHLPHPALGLSRHTLDARLAAAFASAGGELRTGKRITSPAGKPGWIQCTGRRAGRTPWIGLKVHLTRFSLARDLEFHLGADAYVGLSRIEGGAVNLCGLFARRALSAPGAELLLAYLHAAGLPSLAERIRGAEMDPASFCAVAALTFDPRVRGRPDALALGDAGATTPPFTGNGMAMALQGADSAADPVAAYARGEMTWAACCRTVHHTLRRRFRVRLVTAAIVHPFLLRTRAQRWLARVHQAGLLPFDTLYAALH